MEEFNRLVELAARLLEGLGVAVILLGAPLAAVGVIARAKGNYRNWYPLYRGLFGRAILLGLEFLVAADIIRTVSHVPTLGNVTVLGIIVLIRTFLSFTLEVELDGRWPWQKRA